VSPSLTGHLASEIASVELPALELLEELGWSRVNLQAEELAAGNLTGRLSFRQTWLPARCGRRWRGSTPTCPQRP
jgi:type I restriction enzyme R subunit